MHKLKLLAVLLVASLWLPCMASEPANETSKRFELPHCAEELSERVNFHGYAQAGYNYQCCDGETQRNTFQLYRVDAVEGFATKKEGYDKLPDEALAAVQKLVDALN